jgi:hypothetical protein
LQEGIDQRTRFSTRECVVDVEIGGCEIGFVARAMATRRSTCVVAWDDQPSV